MEQAEVMARQLKQCLDSIVLSNVSVSTSVPQTYCFISPLGPSLTEDLRDDYLFEQVLRLIDNLEEQSKIISIKGHVDRCRSLINKLFTRSILNYFVTTMQGLSEYEPWTPIHYQYNEHSKPSIEGCPHLQFSSSTSNDILCLVVQVGKRALSVGVDLSHLHQPSISSTLFRDQFGPLFHAEERGLVAKAGRNGYFAFNYLWTVKEAFTKLLGCGLNCDTTTFYPRLKDASGFLLAENNQYRVEPHPSDEWTSALDISWYTGATMRYDGFDPSEFSSISSDGAINLRSTVLRSGTETSSPVILTIATQTDAIIQCAHVGISAIVRAAVE